MKNTNKKIRILNFFYIILKRFIFFLPEEFSHKLILRTLSIFFFYNKKYNKFQYHSIKKKKIMGISFPNIVGLAAGLDKNGEFIDSLQHIGFGFIEIGTVTKYSQYGNKKPRLFRLIKEESIKNRMGFNNYGINNIIKNIKNSYYQGILGINIGKNHYVNNYEAYKDYIYCMEKIYTFCDYITINISSPNTNNLIELQKEDFFEHLIKNIKIKQLELKKKHNKYTPIAVKISPDLTLYEIKNVCYILLKYKIDAIIATNTKMSYITIKNKSYSAGISGKLLFNTSNIILSEIKKIVKNKIIIISSGGIMSVNDAKTKLNLGADLLQIYTGLIYKGPKLVHDIIINI